MKHYLIEIEGRDFIDIEAEDDDEAISMAIAQADSNFYGDWTANIVKSEDLDEEAD